MSQENMEVAEQVVSHNYAFRLLELGVGVCKKSLYEWRQVELKERVVIFLFPTNQLPPAYSNFSAHAFTVAELGIMLRGFELPYWNWGTGWQVKQFKDEYFRAKNEADARAQLLIRVIEQKIINPAEL